MSEYSVKPAPLGESGRPVRVLNFSGGSFDTIMELGVAHALLVIQGRAPDAIVGVSAGAVQAAAVAEILQAGEDIPVDPQKDDGRAAQCYQRRRAERVERFRSMVNAAQRAPEELIDESLPDAYQIDSRNPIQPLRTARFQEKERNAREEHLRVRSGLIALYNQLLGIHLPVGTVARIVRRVLGYVAANEIRTAWPRRLVKILEWFRIWLLLGAELPRFVKVALLLVRPVLIDRVYAHVATAGSLMFQFRTLRVAWQGLVYSLTLFVLASTWVTISALPAFLAFKYAVKPEHVSDYWVIVAGLTYLIPMLLTAAQAVSMHDSITRGRAVLDGVKGLAQFALSLIIWGGLAYMFIRLIALRNPHDVFDFWNVRPDKHAFFVFLVGTSITGLMGITAWAVWKIDRAKHRLPGGGKTGFLHWYGKRFLQSYSLSKSLLHHYGLEKFLADIFDRSYYGPVNRGEDWENSLRKAGETASERRSGDFAGDTCAKRISHYSSRERKPPIALGLAVADVSTGKVDVMSEDASVVYGLRAATALTPIFPAVAYQGRLFIDSTNVSPVPMPALLSLLHRYGVNPESTVIHVYRVSPVPFSRPPARKSKHSDVFLNLVDTAFRANKLRRYRDADLERRLMERYSECIPAGTISVPGAHEGRNSYRMWVAPIELDIPLGLNARIMFADRKRRREEILTTIAQGCRASLEVMIADSVNDLHDPLRGSTTVSCARAVRKHLSEYVDADVSLTFGCHPLPGSLASDRTDPCSIEASPPGLWEICQHCTLDETAAEADEGPREQVLRWRNWNDTATSWPHEFGAEPGDTSDRHFSTDPRPLPNRDVIDALGRYWPRERHTADTTENTPVNRPLVSVLFSGGVFRGVFQVGAVNALGVLGVKPDIVAGASIGSITAAMAAQLLCVTDDDRNRHGQLARLAAVYLAVDRVILTDRFADFVREFTVRAAGTRFSLRQADQLFRKYDQPWLVKFDKGARQVIGGIERLFYINPYQLRRLVKSARYRRGREVSTVCSQLVQQWLDRMNVGEEVLGAEALNQLIQYFIPSSTAHGQYLLRQDDDALTLHSMFAPFLDKGVILLATSTDLTTGQLLTLGDPCQGADESARVDLVNALLASSAFPGVFRPRWAQEVFPDTQHDHQLIDGGVMDNLPVDAVLNVLRDASSENPDEGLVLRRPTDASGKAIPHLAFAASLEPELESMNGEEALGALQSYWPALRTRAGQLGYNGKLDNYREAALEISRLHGQFPRMQDGVPRQIAVELEIAALKPRWLCGTFAFHPMLGYRRARQSESIAHGCALTLLKFKEYEKDNVAWLEAWGVARAELPLAKTLSEARALWRTRKSKAIPGECWLREGKLCPFSDEALDNINSGLDAGSKLKKATIREVANIHKCCERTETHESH